MRFRNWPILLIMFATACGGAAAGVAGAGDAADPLPTQKPTAIARVPTASAEQPTVTTQAPTATIQQPTQTLVAEDTVAEAAFLPSEPPPRGAEREFSTDFDRHTVPFSDVLSGGPPKDGIPAIDSPTFVSVDEADAWLGPQEPVILFEHDGSARAYPLQILTWHEIVNDVVGGFPVAVTFCPLCNTGIAFDRNFDGQVLDFGTTGRLRLSNLIMYDRQTETWWQQASGDGIAGQYAGRRLTFLPAPIISWTGYKAGFPDGDVLSRDTGFARDYGRNPYVGYDDVDNSPFLYDGPRTPGQLPPMARVLTVDLETEAAAYPYDVLERMHVVNDTIAGKPIVVFWQPGTASALDSSGIASGRDVGAGLVFSRELDGRILDFHFKDGAIVDDQTGSQWNVLGKALGGPQTGANLTPVVGVNHFWFSWAAFRSETRIYEGN